MREGKTRFLCRGKENFETECAKEEFSEIRTKNDASHIVITTDIVPASGEANVPYHERCGMRPTAGGKVEENE